MDPKKIKGKEFFTIELDLENNNITLYVNGELRNKIHTVKAEPLFDRMLKIAKLKFLKMRDQIEQQKKLSIKSCNFFSKSA